ncbi:MAG: 2OG-Fe(II) oxygenase [Bacteroidota bacterium]
MIQHFGLTDIRQQIPITRIQFVPEFLASHEIEAIQKLTNGLQVIEGKILHKNEELTMPMRHSQIKIIESNDQTSWIYQKIANKVYELNKNNWQFDLFDINEFLQYTEYAHVDSHRGHFDWHMDIADQGIASNRKLTFECILDDNHTGGEFSILLGHREHKVKMNLGDAVIFPSFYMNKVYPVLSGKRTSIVSWIAGPSFV